MVTLAEPSLTDTRSSRADFLELKAVFSSRGKSSKATLLGVLDLSGDTAVEEPIFDESGGEMLDEDIVESGREGIIDTTFEELAYRESCLRDAYPFVIDARRQVVTCLGIGSPEQPGRDVYMFCLLASAMRLGQVQGGDDRGRDALEELTKEIAGNFQICACLAAGGFLAGEVSSFGFPRATGDAFLPALRNTFTRFGIGSVRSDVPDGMPTELKDGGIDVIAWKEVPDRMPGKLCILGQCASGKNWKRKSVVEYVGLLEAWFSDQPFKFSTPAMFIPFPVHHDLDEPKRDTFRDSVAVRFQYDERRFGIIFDRLRIPHLADLCMELSEEARQRVESADRFASVNDWVAKTVALVREGG